MIRSLGLEFDIRLREEKIKIRRRGAVVLLHDRIKGYEMGVGRREI